MDSKKTSTKQKKLLKKSISKTGKKPAGTIVLQEFSATEEIQKNFDLMTQGLAEAFFDGDKEAIQDIVGALVRSQNVTKLAAKAKLSRTLIYDAVDRTKNPSIDTLCRIVKAFDHRNIKNRE